MMGLINIGETMYCDRLHQETFLALRALYRMLRRLHHSDPSHAMQYALIRSLDEMTG